MPLDEESSNGQQDNNADCCRLMDLLSTPETQNAATVLENAKLASAEAATASIAARSALAKALADKQAAPEAKCAKLKAAAEEARERAHEAMKALRAAAHDRVEELEQSINILEELFPLIESVDEELKDAKEEYSCQDCVGDIDYYNDNGEPWTTWF